MFSKKIPHEEKRKYKRLDTIFPVEMQVLDRELKPLTNWHQGFSQDISKGGLCIIVNNLNIEKPLNLTAQDTNLLLQIHSPVSSRCFLAYAKVAWVKKVQELPFEQYVAGVSFSRIDPKEINRLLNYVFLKKVVWRSLQVLILGIIVSMAVVVASNARLNARNKVLFGQYSKLLNKNLELNKGYAKITEEKEVLAQMLDKGKLDMEKVKESLNNLQEVKKQEIIKLEQELLQVRKTTGESSQKEARIKDLERKIEELKGAKDKDIAKLEQEIKSLKNKEAMLNNKLDEALAKEQKMQDEYSAVAEETALFAGKFKDRLYDWLKNHQVQKTGLIVSFEGDHNLQNTTFTYDQALAVIAYTLFGDYDKAKRGLDFFVHKAERMDGLGIYNAYYSKSGEVAEYIAHAGPNLWLGIAILQYTDRTGDRSYISLAEQIAQWINSLQDRDGGIFGGKRISWYSTEHNLDGFAFFNMLYKVTQKEQYSDAANKILNWINKYAYGNDSIPINRGKGDSTIATDTYAWSIAALGPKLLKELNMDPDGIIDFAVKNCLVTTDFINRSGNVVKVSGFDFAKHQNVGRGGVVSCEWTSQMILSFSIMAQYYVSLGRLEKAQYYQNQVLKYLNELNKMVISSLSPFGQGGWCLPYASQENADTGHGWRTPSGSKTGSVASTAYTIFAISKFNPLQLQSK
ncbi:MAG: PilZ domain-containing protein [Candidatus Omnitrophica bacterium]|nr:PilZ domain-containing protein [Candidatus Omnitrophota bacterium]